MTPKCLREHFAELFNEAPCHVHPITFRAVAGGAWPVLLRRAELGSVTCPQIQIETTL